MTNRVTYILLENVKGFEESRAYKMFCETLDRLGYVRQGFLLSPKQLGIPNSRQRLITNGVFIELSLRIVRFGVTFKCLSFFNTFFW